MRKPQTRRKERRKGGIFGSAVLAVGMKRAGAQKKRERKCLTRANLRNCFWFAVGAGAGIALFAGALLFGLNHQHDDHGEEHQDETITKAAQEPCYSVLIQQP